MTNVASNRNPTLFSHSLPRKYPVIPYRRTYTISPTIAIAKKCCFEIRVEPESILTSGPTPVKNLLKK